MNENIDNDKVKILSMDTDNINNKGIIINNMDVDDIQIDSIDMNDDQIVDSVEEDIDDVVEDDVVEDDIVEDDIVEDDIVEDDIVEDDVVEDDVVEDDIVEDDVVEDDDTIYFKFNTTNHRLEGKHRLKRDTIFNGKIIENSEENYTSDYYNNEFPIERGTLLEFDYNNYEDSEHQRKLKKGIYDLLSDNTDIDFSSNRRKPNKQLFNSYYEMLLLNLNSKYSRSEIFVELSYYFTDHIFNMYKLLNPDHANNIIKELKEKGFLNELNDINFI